MCARVSDSHHKELQASMSEASRRAQSYSRVQVSRLVKPGGAHQKEQTKGSPQEEQTGPSGCMYYIRATRREGRRDGP